MTWRDGEVAGMAARVARVSFSGELAYEINVPGHHGLAMWEAVMTAGAPFGVTPYGTEAMHVLRAEKGYVIVGQDTDGTVTPHDLGMSWIVRKDDSDFIGKRSLRRPDTVRPDRKQLVGLLPDRPGPLDPRGRAARALRRRRGDAARADARVRDVELPQPDPRADVRARDGEGRPRPDRIDDRRGRPPRDRSRRRSPTPVFYDPEGARRDG